MSNMVIDLNYAKNRRKSILNDTKQDNNTKLLFNVPIKLIIDFHIDLAKIALNLDEDLNDIYFKRILLEDLSVMLNKMSDIAIFLDIDLICETKTIEIDDTESILNALFNNVSMLNYKKEISRLKIKNRIIPLFAQLVQGLGLTLDDLKEYYLNNFK